MPESRKAPQTQLKTHKPLPLPLPHFAIVQRDLEPPALPCVNDGTNRPDENSYLRNYLSYCSIDLPTRPGSSVAALDRLYPTDNVDSAPTFNVAKVSNVSFH